MSTRMGNRLENQPKRPKRRASSKKYHSQEKILAIAVDISTIAPGLNIYCLSQFSALSPP
jgi:hypothetical protein